MSGCNKVEELMKRDDLTNLWKIYTAEAYSSKGFLVVPDRYQLHWTDEQEIIQPDLEQLSPYYDFISNNSTFYEDLVSTARIAVLYSYPSQKWEYPHPRFKPSIYGISNLLLDTHFQFDVLFSGDDNWIEDKLCLDELKRYQVVILPDTPFLTDNQVDMLLAYLKSGGRIIGFGEIGTFNEVREGVERGELQDLLQEQEGPQPYGEGWISYIESNIGLEYFNERCRISRNKFVEEISKFVEPNVITDADNNIAVIKHWNFEKQAYIIHLINYDYDLDEQHIESKKDIGLEVLLNENLTNKDFEILYQSPDWSKIQELNYTKREDRVVFQIPNLDYYGVIYIGEVEDENNY